jgi:hypothetical protein
MPDVDLMALAQSLYQRRHEAVMVPFEARTMASGLPQEHECHDNIRRWISENPDHKPVRGWLVFDLHRTSRGLMSVCRFTAHSVVEEPSGRLIDITPSKASQRYPFLRDNGSEEQFVAIVTSGTIHLDHRVA